MTRNAEGNVSQRVRKGKGDLIEVLRMNTKKRKGPATHDR